jgi:hypothetical protein
MLANVCLTLWRWNLTRILFEVFLYNKMIVKTNQLILCREIISLCCGNCTKFNLLWQSITTVIVSWFVDRVCKNHNKWYTSSPELLCNFIHIDYIIYKCGCRLLNVTWCTRWPLCELIVRWQFVIRDTHVTEDDRWDRSCVSHLKLLPMLFLPLLYY